jgi:hypothetical protein
MDAKPTWGINVLRVFSIPALFCVDAQYVGTASHSRGVKWAGRGIDQPPPSSAEVKERVELCL